MILSYDIIIAAAAAAVGVATLKPRSKQCSPSTMSTVTAL